MNFGILDGETGNDVIARFVVPTMMKNNKPSFVTDTLSLKRSRRSRSAQRWEIETRLEPLNTNAEELFLHIINYDYTERFLVRVPQLPSVLRRKTVTNLPTANGVQGATQVAISGGNGLIPKGLFVKFSGDNKVYLAKNDVTNAGTLNIFPPLQKTVTAGTITTDKVRGYFYYDTETVRGMSFEDGILMDNGTIKLVEAL